MSGVPRCHQLLKSGITSEKVEHSSSEPAWATKHCVLCSLAKWMGSWRLYNILRRLSELWRELSRLEVSSRTGWQQQVTAVETQGQNLFDWGKWQAETKSGTCPRLLPDLGWQIRPLGDWALDRFHQCLHICPRQRYPTVVSNTLQDIFGKEVLICPSVMFMIIHCETSSAALSSES